MFSSTPQESAKHLAAAVPSKRRLSDPGTRQRPPLSCECSNPVTTSVEDGLSSLLSEVVLGTSIKNLPPEILGEIFLDVCFGDVDPGYARCIEANPKSGPQLLSQVCTLWREIVVERPLFWAAIRIGTTTTLDDLKLWIERSRNLPLSFYWDADKPDDGPDDSPRASREQYLGVLLSVMDRWESISVFQLEILYNETDRHFPFGLDYNLLRKMHNLLWDSWDTSALQKLLLSAERRAVWYLPEAHVLDGHGAFWRCLTHIHIGNPITPVQCLSILGKCFLAVYAKFGCIHYNPVNPGAVIVVPELRELIIGTAHFDASIFLNYLTCPRMEALRLGAIGWSPLSNNTVHNFVKRSACPLQEVMIIDCTIRGSIISCLVDAHQLLVDFKLPRFYVCPGLLMSDFAGLIPLAFKCVGRDIDVLDNCVRNSESTCFWFGWDKRRKEAEQSRLTAATFR